MRKSGNLKIFLVLLAVFMLAMPASAATASRSLSSASVYTGDTFQVTLKASDYGRAGMIQEVLPSGFSYKGSTYPYVNQTGNVISFYMLNKSAETVITYNVTAPGSSCKASFNGTLKDEVKNLSPIGLSSITVSRRSSSSGGGSSGGGGGGGGSAEAQSNVEVKELSQAFVSNGKHVKFGFSQGVTCIQYVEFDAKRTAGKITTIAEELKGKSGLVSDLPAGTVYKNVNIWVGNSGTADPENIDKPAIGFSVEKAWLGENGFDASDIAIWYYDDGWKELEAKKIGEDDTNVNFKAETSGFGSFVIIAKGEAATKIDEGSEILPSESAPEGDSTPAAEPEKTPEEDKPSGIPGFGALLSLGILGTVYCVLRRKL